MESVNISLLLRYQTAIPDELHLQGPPCCPVSWARGAMHDVNIFELLEV